MTLRHGTIRTDRLTLPTGSSDTWATTDACNTVQCDAGTQSQAPRYDPTKDSTWESYDISTIFNYGTSAFPRNATGVTGSTTVTLGGMALQNATISAFSAPPRAQRSCGS